MTDDEATSIARSALEKFGIDAQMDQCIEEMAELTQAIIKRKRGLSNDSNLLEEMVDVKIILLQIFMHFSDRCNEMDDIASYKLNRLKTIVNKGE